MKPFSFRPSRRLNGKISLPGDKSIAHRSIICSSLAYGKTAITNLPANKDCLATLTAFKKLGVKITRDKDTGSVYVTGNGLHGLKKPVTSICAQESGTTLRLLVGLLSGQNFVTTLTAEQSLSKRPMLRVIAPLRLMGARIKGRQGSRHEEYAPIRIEGSKLKSITYKMPVASAQVKSAILLAGLYANGVTTVIEKFKTRDHTERMLRLFRAGIRTVRDKISVKGGKELVSPGKIYIPGDISSASFFIVASLIVPGSKVLIKKVSLNPTRAGIINVLKRMGASIKVTSHNSQDTRGEPIGDIIVKSSSLKGTLVKKNEIPFLIDELPVLMVAASFAQGTTVFEGVGELRIKETDRIKSMCGNLTKMGANIKVLKNGNSEKIVIKGTKQLHGARVKSFADHRTAMSMVVASLAAKGATSIDDIACIDKSFPGFLDILTSLIS